MRFIWQPELGPRARLPIPNLPHASETIRNQFSNQGRFRSCTGGFSSSVATGRRKVPGKVTNDYESVDLFHLESPWLTLKGRSCSVRPPCKLVGIKNDLGLTYKPSHPTLYPQGAGPVVQHIRIWPGTPGCVPFPSMRGLNYRLERVHGSINISEDIGTYSSNLSTFESSKLCYPPKISLQLLYSTKHQCSRGRGDKCIM